MKDIELIELMEDSLTYEDIKVINELRNIMRIDDNDNALCALYDLELLFFNKGLKVDNKDK